MTNDIEQIEKEVELHLQCTGLRNFFRYKVIENDNKIFDKRIYILLDPYKYSGSGYITYTNNPNFKEQLHREIKKVLNNLSDYMYQDIMNKNNTIHSSKEYLHDKFSKNKYQMRVLESVPSGHIMVSAHDYCEITCGNRQTEDLYGNYLNRL